MYKRDFILRIIEQIAQFIARMLNLVQDDKKEDAYDFMVKNSGKVVDVSYDDLIKMGVEGFMDMILQKEITSDYLDILGKYFLISAELCLKMEKDQEAILHIELSKACFQESTDRFKTYSFNRQVDLDQLHQLMVRVGLN